MKSKIAFLINQHINHPNVMDALMAYADERIEELRMEFESCSNEKRLVQIQGAISELRRLHKIREHAIAVTERG